MDNVFIRGTFPRINNDKLDAIADSLKKSVSASAKNMARTQYDKKKLKPIITKNGKEPDLFHPVDNTDYSVCLNCGKKEKETKWVKTHFCSLKCFDKFGRRIEPMTTTSIKDLRGMKEMEKELELTMNTY